MPKGAVLTHRNLYLHAIHNALTNDISGDDVIVHTDQTVTADADATTKIVNVTQNGAVTGSGTPRWTGYWSRTCSGGGQTGAAAKKPPPAHSLSPPGRALPKESGLSLHTVCTPSIMPRSAWPYSTDSPVKSR